MSLALLCPAWTQPRSELPSQDCRSNVTKHTCHPRVEEYKGSVPSGVRVGSFRAQSSWGGGSACSCPQDAVSPSPPQLALPPLSAPSWAGRHPATWWPPAALSHSASVVVLGWGLTGPAIMARERHALITQDRVVCPLSDTGAAAHGKAQVWNQRPGPWPSGQKTRPALLRGLGSIAEWRRTGTRSPWWWLQNK